ncbi:Putative hydrolase Mb2247c OS=Mycobacterium bovis (strain ATCC BAA-935 / AF2122/97) GN=Mb2247c PE=3 SV=1 [Rhizoctonia solani AG-1 IB]|uniref:Putative hydrolase Mb2247c n=1 Tax=Thanatephorus cucumeris (strain AG1-IB / isolate 7/3/14) TaxID=1108050 RepID=A0A0B7FSU1_THACB|nr:Putative hydrolase Mb2247c OS=Mycobacterium bovis (strain ATCC BAA-935 / AF2122/97) GN=Mb2247c PE=3 SV=1 [Rhizoctonia solani AG-1 IB]
MDTLLKELGRRCLEYSPDTFQYIGTAAVVRDMIALHDVLEGSDKPLNFWGVSYGTVVGSYFINMFPDRVGQVVLDGVVDPVYWANRPAHLLWDVSVASSEDTFDGFCNACALAGPSECAIAKQNSTAASIRQWTQELLDKAYHHKRQFGSAAQVTSARIRNRLFGAMYSPSSWPSIAEVLASYSDLLSNTTISTKARRTEERIIFPGRNTNSTENDTTVDDPAFDYSFQGITCADAIDTVNVTTKDVFDMILSTARNVSPTFGPLWGDAGFFCHHWPVRAVERYTGPWNKTLSSTIIVIGNEADPITPLISAKKLADALGDSAVLIEQDDYGHSSLAMHSNCTVAALQNYFVHNKLPTQDIFCGTNQVLFPAAGGDVTKKTVDRAKAASKVEARRPS